LFVWLFCLFVCLFDCFVCLFVCLIVLDFVWLLCLFVWLFCLFVCLIVLFVCLIVWLLCLFVWLFCLMGKKCYEIYFRRVVFVQLVKWNLFKDNPIVSCLQLKVERNYETLRSSTNWIVLECVSFYYCDSLLCKTFYDLSEQYEYFSYFS
jgi:hypothetical protein